MKNLLLLCCILFSSNLFAATSYEAIVNRIKTLDAQPNTGLFSLGKNDQGQDILGLVIGDPSRPNAFKQLVVGTHHGNERMAAEVPVHFIELALSHVNNPSSPFHASLENTVFYVVPVLNISGYNRNSRQETSADGRNYDSNRDYEDPCTTKQDFHLKSTGLIAEFLEQENIISAVSVHGYVGTFTFPWGTTAANYETQDHLLMNDLARKSVVHNKYNIGTHGGAIYPATGAFEDWAYYKLGVWSYLLEIRSTSSDLKKDALTLLQFFLDAPVERSRNVGQRVNCVERILKAKNFGRP